MNAGVTTLLPLVLVIFYLFLGLTNISELNLGEIDDNEWGILLGKYKDAVETGSMSSIEDLFYVNVFDSILMLTGIFSGIFVAFIYILFFVNWTTSDIVLPVNELMRRMEKTGKGEMDQFSIVRTNDEIGVLTAGYNDMSQKIRDYINSISRINQANSRFVPKQFLEYLGKESIADISLGDQVQQEMTVMFCDIRNFTSISEDMSPRENFNFLNNYLGYMEPIIRRNMGFVDKYIGDSIMALFSERAEDALNAAIEMRIKLIEFNQVMEQFGKPPISNGFGIHTGNLMLGIVGGEGRMDGTVISDAVNLSSRLEGLNKLYGGSIIISEDTLIRINDPSHYNYRFLDIVKVKGKKEAVYIFEVLDGEPAEVKELKIKTKTEFGKALQLYKNKQFEKALEIFLEIYSENPEDRAAFVYLNRCKKLIREGVPDDWDGIERIDNKFD
ncbi:MAG: adenylate/guanylate cyclase domain-containing protein [Bacteroidota bacterium]|nr:adenylate/guanylate cyclase domain-containing protein [Bacteroidota bacterium]